MMDINIYGKIYGFCSDYNAFFVIDRERLPICVLHEQIFVMKYIRKMNKSVLLLNCGCSIYLNVLPLGNCACSIMYSSLKINHIKA